MIRAGRHTPLQLRRFLAEHERIRAQGRLDLMHAVNVGLAGGESYGELAEKLLAIIDAQ